MMARAFSEYERENIRRKLIAEGRKKFAAFGLKKTGIDDLVQAAGISKGSFYAFFGSKEELYLEVIEAEESSFRETVMARVAECGPANPLKTFILEGLKIMGTNSLIQQVLRRDGLEQVLRAVPPAQLARHLRADEDWMREVVVEWQKQGLIADVDPGAVVGAIVFLITSTLHKDVLGGDSYPEAMNLLVDLVVSGLTPGNNT
jgi:AcrR family transcriptional regulator